MQIPNTLNTAGGNTITPASLPKTLRKCCFTFNNYTNIEYHKIVEICNDRNYKYCIGEEVGENGTKHLQGYMEFSSPKTFATLKKLLPKAHIEKAKGTRKQNLTYCKKDGKFLCNFPVPLEEQVLNEYKDIEWRPWQQEILDLYVQPPNKRHIYWVIDSVGNKGKTFLTRYLVVKHKILLADGKKADVFHQVAKRLENEDDQEAFRMVILDLPRHNQEFTNYGLLEQLKNGLVMSGKYEGGTFAFPSPHVIVMSNQEPDYEKFSLDRWKVINLDNN